MALTDFWQVVDRQVLDGVQISNVYHVKRIKATANAADVAKALIDSVIAPALKILQDDALTRTTIDVFNLGDPTDFVSFDSSGQPGTRLDQFPSTFFAAGIKFPTVRRDIHSGQKRFCVGGEGDNNNGTWLAAFITSLDTLATAIVTPWEEVALPGIDVCEYVVLGRHCKVLGQDPCLEYRLPITDAEIDGAHYVPTAGIPYAKPTSQVSRKTLF